jgi:hypothetical protein
MMNILIVNKLNIFLIHHSFLIHSSFLIHHSFIIPHSSFIIQKDVTALRARFGIFRC